MANRLVAAVRTFVSERRIAGPVVAAVSGGADSVALLRALREAGCDVVVAHVNHQLRGAESDADEAFVSDLARALDVPFHSTRLAIPQNENLEAAARRLRYEWLEEIAGATGTIATGHTADDQAETVLHRMIRGTGLQGLRGIVAIKFSRDAESSERSAVGHPHMTVSHSINSRPALGSEDSASRLNGRVVRPMLAVTRNDVLEYLHALGQPFRIDSSNADPRFTRNRIRQELLPLLRSFNPEIVSVLGRLAEQASEAFDFVEGEAMRLLSIAERPRAGAMLIFDKAALETVSPLFVRELFRLVWRRENWPMNAMTFDHWNRLANLVVGDYPGQVSLRGVGNIVQIVKTI